MDSRKAGSSVPIFSPGMSGDRLLGSDLSYARFLAAAKGQTISLPTDFPRMKPDPKKTETPAQGERV